MSFSSKPVEFQAKSLDLALIKAAGSFGVSQAEIEFKVLEEKKGSFFGLFSKPEVTISAWLKSTQTQGSGRGRSSDAREGGRPRRSSGGRDARGEGRGDGRRDNGLRRDGRDTSREPRRARETHDAVPREKVDAVPLTAEQQETLVNELRTFCAETCAHMVGETVNVSHEIADDRLIINIDHDEVAALISKSSKLAEALEHLLRKKPRHLKQELPFRVFIDAGGVRMQRERSLIQMASDLSEKVHENKRPIVLNYRSPYDRKIIHMALDKDERVYTKSIGNGPNRKLMILPSKESAAGGHEKYETQESLAGLEQIEG